MPTAVSIFFALWLSTFTQASYPVVFDDSESLGRQFEGIGAISGGGATSKLLVNYPREQRDEILDYLFKPNFGASLQIFKVEIGGDVQSTDGTEASHMHTSWDENYERGYEWWMLQEAKKRNPDIKIYCLPWGFPGWIGKGTNNPYTDVETTADYVVRWINGAKQVYNITVDYVGIWNERAYNVPYIKTLRSTLDSRGFQNVKIIASDGGWGIAKDILKDKDLAKDVHAIGAHYPGTNSSEHARSTLHSLWASEDYSTFNNNVGAGCWARILNQNYVNGLMTSTIAWNLIASYYRHLPFQEDGLMNAFQPWSGHYQVNSPIWITAHTTQFVPIGWRYLEHGAGTSKLQYGGSHVALTNSDRTQLTIVIETMTREHSICVRPRLPHYTVESQEIEIVLEGSFASLSQLNVWHSKLGFHGNETVLFEERDPIKFKNGRATLTLNPDEIYTLTTMTTGQKGAHPAPPSPKPFPLPYSDDFEGYLLHQEPFNLAPQIGSYEVMQGTQSKVMRQTVQDMPVHWCEAEAVGKSLSTIGSFNWTEIFIQVDFQLSPINGTDGVFVAARVDRGGCWGVRNGRGIFFFVFEGKYILSNDLARKEVLWTGHLPHIQGWHTISLLVEDSTVTAAFDREQLFEVDVPPSPKNGFAGLGTDSFGLADFDNFQLASAEDGRKIMKSYQKSALKKSLYWKSRP